VCADAQIVGISNVRAHWVLHRRSAELINKYANVFPGVRVRVVIVLAQKDSALVDIMKPGSDELCADATGAGGGCIERTDTRPAGGKMPRPRQAETTPVPFHCPPSDVSFDLRSFRPW
jgi:hypothetical protein